MVMDHDVLLGRVKRWGGMTGKREAEHAIFATLKALREALFDDEADELARELPPRLAAFVRSGSHRARMGAKAFYEEASRCEGVSMGFAVEHAQAVCQALASLVPPSSVARLTHALPELAALFVVPDRDSHPKAVLSPHATTLAEGHPGSDHPLSDASPPPGGRSGPESR
jgi:uncharacterized protein (DUF2267 family)